MVVDTIATFPEWKQNFIAEIEALPHTVAKGDAFVHKVLQIYYNLSEEDAIDATECAGAGDKGVDAICVFPAENDDNPNAIVVQGKYGTAGTNLDIYVEARKFFHALKISYNGTPVTTAVDTVANVLKNDGIIRYIIATLTPLDESQQKSLEDIKKIANFDFGDKLVVEAINLENLYVTLGGVKSLTTIHVHLSCQVIPVKNGTYIGATNLNSMYSLLRSYSEQAGGTIDSIYDHNIRKYLRRRTGSVNDGIYKTLEKEASRFIAYNNGITIVCRAAQVIEEGLGLDTPYIVNGCQTTRTLYDFMNTKFAGIDPLRDAGNKMAAYNDAFLAIKILVVDDKNSDTYANDITRFSNKQNAIRGKDFIALEDLYKSLKKSLKAMGYFLETQAGEYETLSKNQRQRYPKDTHVINSFEATLFYAAGLLGKPYLTFGHSGDFTPGGREFDETVKDIEADDLLIPWMIAAQARELGYTAIAQRNPKPETAHRGQTRYFFLYLFFRLAKDVFIRYSSNDAPTKHDIYRMLKAIKADYDLQPNPNHPFYQLLTLTDVGVATYMDLAEDERWFSDRNSFFKREELIRNNRIIMATAAAKRQIAPIANQIKQIMSKEKTIFESQ
jgi:hypothetical protein